MRILAAALALALAATACGDDDTDAAPSTQEMTTTTSASQRSTAPESTSSTEPPPEGLELGALEPVVTGLEVPWDLAFVDADTLFVTERPGRVRVVEGGVLRDEPALTLDVRAQGEGGLLGIALHPDFPESRHAYLYTTTDADNRVTRHEVSEDLVLGPGQVLIDGIASAAVHDGGRIAFGPDGMLYVTTGDATEPSVAADLDQLAGKILRLTPDGDVPDDNPFDGSFVWSYGHRNPQGVAWADDGTMYASEHGPSGDLGLCCRDEVNRIEPGGFYGWPFRAGTDPGLSGEPPAEAIDPVASSGDDTWAPAGIAVAPDGSTALVAALRGTAVLRIDLGSGSVSTADDSLGRVRVVELGPDGCIWVATSNTDGRGSPGADDDRLLRSC